MQHDVRTMQAALENQKKEDDSKKITVLILSYLKGCHGNIAVGGHQGCCVVFDWGVNPIEDALMVFACRGVDVGQAFGWKGLAGSLMHVFPLHS